MTTFQYIKRPEDIRSSSRNDHYLDVWVEAAELKSLSDPHSARQRLPSFSQRFFHPKSYAQKEQLKKLQLGTLDDSLNSWVSA